MKKLFLILITFLSAFTLISCENTDKILNKKLRDYLEENELKNLDDIDAFFLNNLPSYDSIENESMKFGVFSYTYMYESYINPIYIGDETIVVIENKKGNLWHNNDNIYVGSQLVVEDAENQDHYYTYYKIDDIKNNDIDNLNVINQTYKPSSFINNKMNEILSSNNFNINLNVNDLIKALNVESSNYNHEGGYVFKIDSSAVETKLENIDLTNFTLNCYLSFDEKVIRNYNVELIQEIDGFKRSIRLLIEFAYNEENEEVGYIFHIYHGNREYKYTLLYENETLTIEYLEINNEEYIVEQLYQLSENSFMYKLNKPYYSYLLDSKIKSYNNVLIQNEKMYSIEMYCKEEKYDIVTKENITEYYSVKHNYYGAGINEELNLLLELAQHENEATKTTFTKEEPVIPDFVGLYSFDSYIIYDEEGNESVYNAGDKLVDLDTDMVETVLHQFSENDVMVYLDKSGLGVLKLIETQPNEFIWSIDENIITATARNLKFDTFTLDGDYLVIVTSDYTIKLKKND